MISSAEAAMNLHDGFCPTCATAERSDARCSDGLKLWTGFMYERLALAAREQDIADAVALLRAHLGRRGEQSGIFHKDRQVMEQVLRLLSPEDTTPRHTGV